MAICLNLICLFLIIILLWAIVSRLSEIRDALCKLNSISVFGKN